VGGVIVWVASRQNSTKTVPKQYQENRASGYIGAPGGTLGAELGTVVTPPEIGLILSNLEMHEQIQQYKKEHPEVTQEEIARQFDCDQSTVSKILYDYIPYNIRDIIRTTPEHGTSLSYTLRRLKEDHPELYQRVVAGELSANAAAREAGIRRPTTNIYTDDAASIARTPSGTPQRIATD
jgi:hypothetical protein